MQILLLQKRQFKISADVISSNTNFVVSTFTFLSLIFNVLIKHDHIREDKSGLLKLQTSSFHCHHHQSSAMFYKTHLFSAVYKISVNICKDIIKLNIYINNDNKTFLSSVYSSISQLSSYLPCLVDRYRVWVCWDEAH